ncbi:hypothetical protein BJV78DRAFT_1216283 [Lactifluus subvellereus]|nr:hypothetical protein BJV78DRAFT_1216283 [Lactifluus subvellereus]
MLAFSMRSTTAFSLFVACLALLSFETPVAFAAPIPSQADSIHVRAGPCIATGCRLIEISERSSDPVNEFQ